MVAYMHGTFSAIAEHLAILDGYNIPINVLTYLLTYDEELTVR